METFEEKLKRVTAEEVDVRKYDVSWLKLFDQEKVHLLNDLPNDLIIRIEHFGSTAVPNLAAKPIVDMLIEVCDVKRAKIIVPKILEPQGYDCFWRPTFGDDIGPWYTWCIRRDKMGNRTHHLHFVAVGSKSAELKFRDILRAHSEIATQYGKLKLRLLKEHKSDRVAYTQSKGEFIQTVLNNFN